MYLKLIESDGGRVIEARDAVVHLGRAPESQVLFADTVARVVSARHATIRWADGEWRLVDLGSRNGTFLNGQRVSAETALRVGDTVSLGESGPKLTVAATSDSLAPTLPEHPGILATAPRPYALSLLHVATGVRFDARGPRTRIGRGRECEIQLLHETDAVVSRVHAELRAGSGGVVLADAGSKNGTWLNGERVTTPTPVGLSDEIMLGRDGPILRVTGLGTERRPRGAVGAALEQARAEREKGGRGSTAFLRAVAAQVGSDSGHKLRWLVTVGVVLVLLLGGALYGVYVLLSGEVHDTAQRAQGAEDSARAAGAALARDLAAARAAAAPAVQVDSLRAQLESAQARTTALGVTLERAQAALSDQLALGESRRAAAQGDLARLRDELASAERRAPPAGLLDSLRRAVAGAEEETAGVEAKLRALRGTDFASIAERNQGAIGLVTVELAHRYYSGTGFVISPEGYMLTNWHVVADSTGQADTIWVTMADRVDAHYADVVVSSEQRDLALLKIRGYQGPVVSLLDWGAEKARQGEPAALIGFPAGSGFARAGSASAAVRTSMTAGIISRVTEEIIQFDGITIGGSSGSPLFNANGEVIAVHRAGLVQSPGFALSIPLKQAVPLLPFALRQRLVPN